MVLTIDEGTDVIGGKFEAVSVGDSVCGAGLYAVTAKDASRIIDVIDTSVPLTRRNSLRFRVFGGFDVNASRRTCRSAQKTADAFLKPILISMQHVYPTVARLKMYRFVGIVFRDRLTP